MSYNKLALSCHKSHDTKFCWGTESMGHTATRWSTTILGSPIKTISGHISCHLGQKQWASLMDCKIMGFNPRKLLSLQVHIGGVPHMSHLFAWPEGGGRSTWSILWKQSHHKRVVTVPENLNTRWTSCKQQRELRSKCSEMEKNVLS